MFSDGQPVREVGAKELARGLHEVLDQVADGTRVIVTRHGHPVAVMLSVDHGIDAMLAGSERFTLLRREAREELQAGLAATLETWNWSRP